MGALHHSFLSIPIAHRALHDPRTGCPENSRSAARAAMTAGYGIEIDVQLSADGVAMVFHDEGLARLTKQKGPVSARTAAELGRMRLRGGSEGIPTLAEVAGLVCGQVPLLVEIKDQDGALGPDVGALEAAVAADLRGYAGPVAVMSFNPGSMAAMAKLAPEVPRGLVTCAFSAEDWPQVPAAIRARLREIADYERVGACFISHQASDLGRARVAQLRDSGAAILCWTVRTSAAEAEARRIAHNITFEGYRPALPEGARSTGDHAT